MACQGETYVIFSALFAPSMGGVENYTLNVAQASTACMYEWLRQNWA